MNQSIKTTMTFVAWIWSHLSAAISLTLIIAALVVGYQIGSGTPSNTQMNPPMVGGHDHGEASNDKPAVYTCSMHPTVRLNDPDSKCPICFMDLIPVMDNNNGAGNELQLVLSESAKAMSQIETTRVQRFFPTAQVRLYGKLGYDETSVARISAYFPGRIDRLFVNYVGVTVQEGDHLAELYSPDLIAAFEELRQAKKSFDQSSNGSAFLQETTTQTLEASREKLRLYGITTDQIEQIESGSFDANQLTIYSPIGGVVTNLGAREGDYLETGDPIATVANLSRLWLDLESYESQLPMLRWGLPVTFTVESHPGEVFNGQISFIEPIVDSQTRTAAVRVAVDNSDGRLKPGMFASATAHPKITAQGAVLSDDLAGRWISPMHPTVVKDAPGSCDVCGMDLVAAESLGLVGDSSTIEKPLVIPRTAVLFTGRRSVVYIQVKNTDEPTYEGRTVELGPLAGDFYTVRSGLREGDEVVTHGAFRVDSAMQIMAKPSMMMPEGGPSGAGHQHGGSSTTMAPMSTMGPGVPQTNKFARQLDSVYTAYLNAQERLADDDHAGFLQASQVLNHAAATIEPIGFVGEQLGIWRRARAKLTSNVVVNGITIEDSRARFEHMSMAIIELQDQFGHVGDEPLHVAFCPMAFDFEGAKWLQRGTQINNPYFGDAMLRCGDIQQTLEPIEPGKMNAHEGDAHE